MSYHIIVHLSSHITIHINSHVNNVCDIYVIETGPGLSWADLNVFYNGAEMSWIVSIYNVFIKLSRDLICDAQSREQNITQAFL
jgi:hypothetical protein